MVFIVKNLLAIYFLYQQNKFSAIFQRDASTMMLETYLKRLTRLEEIAKSFDGVDNCFAIQAGREIRIMVKPDKVDDVASALLAHDIVKKIEAELEYPGQIKATVIRETRVVDYAK